MKTPDMDTRMIRRLESDAFTVESQSAITAARRLCDHCATEKCHIRNYLKRNTSAMLQIKVESCATFTPALGFSVLTGLDAPRWNTVRLGKAWAERLKPRQRVAIVDTTSRRIMRYMRVERAEAATLSQIVATHATRNHALVGRALSAEEASAALTKILQNAYGRNYAAPGKPASVIYLQSEDPCPS